MQGVTADAASLLASVASLADFVTNPNPGSDGKR
jgi:hypothetical protein